MKLLFAILLLSVLLLGGASCNPTPEPTPPEPEPSLLSFDLYVCAVKHGGMGQNKNGTYVRSVPSLEADQPLVEFTGKGIDITQQFTMESITRGKYYYQVPQEGSDRFVKFHIERNEAGEEWIPEPLDAEVPFKSNTYYARKYTHAWLDDGETLLVLGTDSEHKEICWTKLRESDLAILSEGKLGLTLPEGFTMFSTSGLLTVRPSDGTLFYIYYVKDDDSSRKPVTHVAVINPSSMQVVSDSQVPEAVMEEPVTAAYGELLRNIIAYDEIGTMYVAGLCTYDGVKLGVMRRILPGASQFDPSWNGFPSPEGRLLTLQYVGNGRMLAYSRDEKLGTKIDSRSHFYSIINLTSCQRERVSYNGEPLRYCSGGYSQRSAVVDGKAYIGVTEGDGPDDNPMVYIYDSATDRVEPGVRLSKGFCFDIIRAMVEIKD
jgi:hypothetical protein